MSQTTTVSNWRWNISSEEQPHVSTSAHNSSLPLSSSQQGHDTVATDKKRQPFDFNSILNPPQLEASPQERGTGRDTFQPNVSRLSASIPASSGLEVQRVPTPPTLPPFSCNAFPLKVTAPESQLQITSTTTLYPSYSPLGHVSLAPHSPRPLSPHQYRPGYGSATGPAPKEKAASSEGSFEPAMRTITIDTGQGPIEIPLNVQAASKEADEKRKRNAGASARFRVRRKKKEQDFSQTIAKLKQRVKEAEEDLDLCRRERDHLRVLVDDQVVERPLALRMWRATQASRLSTSGSSWPGAKPREGTPRSARQRTDTYARSYTLPPLTTL